MMPSLMNAGRSRGDGAHGVRIRMVILQILVLSLIVTLFGRLWYLQIRNGDSYANASTNNNLRDVVTQAVRGHILDDRGYPLVSNRAALVVSVSRTELMKMPDGGDAVLGRLAEVLGMPAQDLKLKTRLCERNVPQPCWNGSPYQPIPITESATTQQALQIMEHREDFPGVTAEMTGVRQYPAPDGANAAHLLGYLSPVTDEELVKQKENGGGPLQRSDEVGRSGLERTYDTDLRGITGVTKLGVDHLGRVTGVVQETPAVPGNHLVTSIDSRIQAIAEQQLGEAIKRARSTFDAGNTGRNFVADSGAVVVMDVRTGRIVAMASTPSYNPDVWTGGISVDDYRALTDQGAGVPLISRAIQGQFAPGSIFKVISTAGAAEAGYSIKSNYPCPSSISVGGITFNNLESASYGDISLQRALEVSCNTVFYGLAYDMWLKDGGFNNKNAKDPMQTMARAFGLGSPTGIDLPGEAGGNITTREAKRENWLQHRDEWCRQAKSGKNDLTTRVAAENCQDGWQLRAGDAVNFSIGQGDTTVTPLQMARVYAAIANGGTLYQPLLGKAIMTPDGKLVRTIDPVVQSKLPVSDATIKYLQKSLHTVTTNGTASRVFANWPNDKLPMAAKTGTGSVENKQSTSWFATYGPVNDPQYSIVMMVSQGGTGSGTSGPSVRKIYEALLGVDENGTYDPARALLPGPPDELPKIAPDGSLVQASFQGSLPGSSQNPLQGTLPGSSQGPALLPVAPAAPAFPAGPAVLAMPGALPPDRPAYHGGRNA